LIKPESVDLDLGTDREIELGQSVLVDAKINGAYVRLDWDVNTNISCDTCVSISLKPDGEARLKATVYNKYGCYDVDDLIIFVRKNHVYVPNVFSPNGDGVNDGFTVFGDVDEVAEVKSMEIYDRWGAQVFNKTNFGINDYNTGWNGEFKGQALIPGVYVYHIVVKFKTGIEKKLSGEVSLIR
jgi:gliding motility-associated-like protein